jgi:cytochrome P450
MSTNTAPYWDPYLPEIVADPHPAFRRLREEAPLYYNDKYDFYAISRFDDVERAFFDKETYISGRGGIIEVIKSGAQFPPGMLIFNDPPVHTYYRTLLSRIFTPKRARAMEVTIRDYCAKCLDPFVGARDFDFVRDLGAQMPMSVIGMLLGIPKEDHEKVRENADARLRTERGKPMNRDYNNLGEGFEGYVDWRYKNPSDDVITDLITAEVKDDTGTLRRLRREEVLTLVNVLAGAGNETTNRLIGWTGKVLGQHPDQRRQVAGNLELVPQTIEEILRFEPPAPHVARYVSRDVELYGQKVPKGSVMVMLPGAANRDDRRFTNPDQFDINREKRPHITFGFGIHVCAGAALARMEGRIALEEVLKRFPDWEVDMDNAHLSPTSTVRGWESMPVRLAGGTRIVSRPAKEEAAPAKASSGPVTFDGTWTVVTRGPTGPKTTTLVIQSAGSGFTGTQSGQGQTSEISGASFDGKSARWVHHVTKPMKINVEFSGTVEGNVINGKAKAGFMGSFPFTATKS